MRKMFDIHTTQVYREPNSQQTHRQGPLMFFCVYQLIAYCVFWYRQVFIKHTSRNVFTQNSTYYTNTGRYFYYPPFLFLISKYYQPLYSSLRVYNTSICQTRFCRIVDLQRQQIFERALKIKGHYSWPLVSRGKPLGTVNTRTTVIHISRWRIPILWSVPINSSILLYFVVSSNRIPISSWNFNSRWVQV